MAKTPPSTTTWYNDDTAPTLNIEKIKNDTMSLMKTKVFIKVEEELDPDIKVVIWKFAPTESDNGAFSLYDDSFYRLLYTLIMGKLTRASLPDAVVNTMDNNRAIINNGAKVIKECSSGANNFFSVGEIIQTLSADNTATTSIISKTGVAATGGVGAILGLISTYLSMKTTKLDNLKLASAHIMRVREICGVITSHLDHSRRISGLGMPLLLPGQTASEYESDLKQYVYFITQSLATMLQECLVIHRALGTSILKGDARNIQFNKIIDKILDDASIAKKTQKDISNTLSKFRQTLTASRVKQLLSMLGEELNNLVDDMNFFITIRSAERLQYMQIQTEAPPSYIQLHQDRNERLLQDLKPTALAHIIKNEIGSIPHHTSHIGIRHSRNSAGKRIQNNRNYILNTLKKH